MFNVAVGADAASTVGTVHPTFRWSNAIVASVAGPLGASKSAFSQSIGALSLPAGSTAIADVFPTN